MRDELSSSVRVQGFAFAVASFVLFAGASLQAKDKHTGKSQAAAQDEIVVASHVALPGGPVTRFVVTQHYRRTYLNAEHGADSSATLVDVTSLESPAVLAEMPLSGSASGSLVSVAGNAALVRSSGPSTSNVPSSAPQTFRIMSFADPLHPAVKQEFAGVIAMDLDERRGLIFLANNQGLWILQQHYAMDPEAVKEWEHMMLDAR